MSYREDYQEILEQQGYDTSWMTEPQFNEVAMAAERGGLCWDWYQEELAGTARIAEERIDQLSCWDGQHWESEDECMGAYIEATYAEIASSLA